MALPDLKLIGQLNDQAEISGFFAESYCYNSKNKLIDPLLFMICIKQAKQAEALFKNLERLHKRVTNFAAGNFQSYVEEHEAHADPSESDFNPFNELDFSFDSSSIYDLPPFIEQYQELVDFLPRFVEYRKRLGEGFNKFFSGLEKKVILPDEEGELIPIPLTELPEEVQNQLAANREIRDIQVEYCLDGYNEFYQKSRMLIDRHRAEGTIVACAVAILSLFAPYNRE